MLSDAIEEIHRQFEAAATRRDQELRRRADVRRVDEFPKAVPGLGDVAEGGVVIGVGHRDIAGQRAAGCGGEWRNVCRHKRHEAEEPATQDASTYKAKT